MTNFMKVVISNQLVEVTQQSILPPSVTSLGGRKSTFKQGAESYKVNHQRSIIRARKNIRRLLECNFNEQYAFITLTFDPAENKDVTNIKRCNKLFSDFKKRLRYYLNTHNRPSFRYLGVIEFQDKQGSGRIHYHIVCNLTELCAVQLQRLWQYGRVHKVTTSSEVTENEKIAYYLSKGITDARLNGSKKYFHSRGLKQPIILDVEDQDEFYLHLNECQPTLKQGETYQSPFTGTSKYEQYYVKNTKELIHYVQKL
jgi:hypothetical protein